MEDLELSSTLDKNTIMQFAVKHVVYDNVEFIGSSQSSNMFIFRHVTQIGV